MRSIKQFFFMAVFLLTSGAVYGGWVSVEKEYQGTDIETVYFDPETIHRNGARATLWQLTDIKWNSTTRYLSTKIYKEFDCQNSRMRVLQVIEFSRQMGRGRSATGYIENGNWQPIGNHSLNQALWRIACVKH